MYPIKKRGAYHIAAVLLVPLIGLIFVAIFFPSVLHRIMEIGETTFFEKNFVVRDMAIITNALYVSHGNIIVNYDKDTYWFSYEFNKDKVVVFDETSTLKTKTKYQIINNSLLNFNPITLKAKFHNEDKSEINLKEKVKPIFAKINDDIFINDKIDRSIGELNCIRKEPIGELQNKIFLIDAGHGGADSGVMANNVKENDIAGAIGFSIYSALGDNRFFTRELEDYKIRKVEYKSKEKIIEEVEKNKIDVIISIHTGDYSDDSNNVKAYYSLESNQHIQEKNRKIACEVLNELIKQEVLEISGISIIGIYPEDYEGGEILVKDKMAVLFEIGNLKNEKSVNVLTQAGNIQIISDSIIRGLKNAE